jgi:hypothetical protein
VKEEIPLWDRRIRPYVEWVCRRYVARASSWTTVGPGIADEYERVFGFRPAVVTNATPFHDLSPRPVGSPLRLVHSGGAQRPRRLELIIDGVLEAHTDASLDLYLTRNDPAYLAELEQLAAAGDGRVRILPPVAYRDLIPTLARYDVGIHVLPDINFNHRWALPNKVFDYVQARLGVIVGPSPEMARLVRGNELGLVTSGFTAADVARAVEALTSVGVTEMKRAAHRHARELSAEHEASVWARAIAALGPAVDAGGMP